MKAFIILQFSHCPWMFHNRNTENGVNKIHKRALRLVSDDRSYLSFDKLLKRQISEHSSNKSPIPAK